MVKLSSLVALAAVFNLTVVFSQSNRPTSATNSRSFQVPKAMTLTTEFKNNQFYDISADGRLLVLYETKAPTRLFTDPRPEYPRDDLLRVAKIESGEEIARIATKFFPSNVSFLPGSQRVFYSEPENASEYALKLWDYSAGRSAPCSDENAFGIANVSFLNDHAAVGTFLDEHARRASLIRIDFPDCGRRVIGPADPSNPAKYRVFGPLTISPDRTHLAHKVPGVDVERILVRDVESGNTIKSIEVPGFYLGPKTFYTPDGRFLIVVAATTSVIVPATRRYLFFYDARTYELKRQLEVTSWDLPDPKNVSGVLIVSLGTAWTVSPDGHVIAVGYRTTDARQPFIVLYDLESGKELFRASYPPVRPRRDDPFLGTITSLAFTPDGKYLISSTYDTRVWRIQ